MRRALWGLGIISLLALVAGPAQSDVVDKKNAATQPPPTTKILFVGKEDMRDGKTAMTEDFGVPSLSIDNPKTGQEEQIDQARWLALDAKGRTRLLMELLDASQNKEGANGRPRLACYRGTPRQVTETFFGKWSGAAPQGGKTLDKSKDPYKVDPKGIAAIKSALEKGPLLSSIVNLVIVPSSDLKMIGVAFTKQGKWADSLLPRRFRFPHCDRGSGKSTPGSEHLTVRPAEVPTDQEALESEAEALAEQPEIVEELKEMERAKGHPDYGFTMLDEVTEWNHLDERRLPRFQLKADYEKWRFDEAHDRPWKGSSLATAKSSMDFALLLQAYAYQGLTTSSNKAGDDYDVESLFDPSRFDKSTNGGNDRYWCHTPWQNVGFRGREAIHGLTQEFPLGNGPGGKPNIYYGEDVVPNTLSNWGVAIYNGPGCKTFLDIFGPSTARRAEPAWQSTVFGNGTAIVKYLFTELDQTPKTHSLDKALRWHANVALDAGKRTVKPVRHMQMDVALRDDQIAGTRAENSHWVFLTYYFDPRYTTPAGGPVAAIPNLPEPLRHMRPMGVQVGFDNGVVVKSDADVTDKADSIIFADAKTNHADNRLNGPADNPVATCLGCHAAAGTTFPSVPGVLSQADYSKAVHDHPQKGTNRIAGSLDFSMQLSIARENRETEALPYLFFPDKPAKRKAR